MSTIPPRGFERHARTLGEFLDRTGKHVDSFWQRVTDGIEIQVLWAQFMAEARASYGLYAREVDWDSLKGETHGRRVWLTTKALFWAMLMKLSPARRVFLLIALVLAVLAMLQIRIGRPEGNAAPPGGFNLFHLLSLAALLFLLALELADRVTMKRDLEIAREIQRWLVPEKPPKVEGVDIAFASRPANTVGGDYYDAFLRNGLSGPDHPGRLLLVVADVAGKSVPAALLMATFQASLRTLAAAPTSLEELVTGMNGYACAHSLGGRRFTTAFFAELDLASRQFSYVRAGHNEPILRRANGQQERLSAGDLPLGIDPKTRYQVSSIAFAAGDSLIIFTDGLVEAVNARDEEYGEARVLESARAVPAANADTTLRAMMASVDAFVGAARQHDDVTLLIARLT